MTRIILRATEDRLDSFGAYLRRVMPERTEYVVDHEQNGAMHTFIRALEAAGDDPVVLMEDDVLVCVDFDRLLELEVSAHPDHHIQLFNRRNLFKGEDSLKDGLMAPGSTFSMNQCHYLPKGEAKLLLEFYNGNDWRRKLRQTAAYDWLIADYLATWRQPYWVRRLSLVDHRVGRSSIDPRRARSRTALVTEPIDNPRDDE